MGGDTISFSYRYRKQIIIAFFILVTLCTGSYYFYRSSYFKTKESKKIKKNTVLMANKKNNTTLDVKKTTSTKFEVKSDIFLVDIKGEVVNPGLYSLESGKRVSDVIQLAGGLTENADTSVINLSKKVTDEMVIIIYSKYEVADFKKTKEVEKQVQDSCLNYYEGIKNDACIQDNNNNNDNTSISNENKKVSINTASLEELQTLTGIGESKAKSIIEYREENGGFKDVTELKNISGIGDSIFDKIKENITL